MGKYDKLFARYKRYEGPPGDPEQWSRAAQSLVNSRGASLQDSLQALGLSTMPKSLPELSLARRKIMAKRHPDVGGTEAQAVAINAAYNHLSSLFSVTQPVVGPTVTPPGFNPRVITPPRCVWDLPENLDDPNLIADVKIDGERFLMYINLNPYSGDKVTTLLSKYLSKITKQFGNRSAAHPDIAHAYPGLDGTILDGELFQGRFIAFDIPFHNGKDLRKLPLRERRIVLKQVITQMANPQVQLIQSFTKDIYAKFLEITQAGGEGLVVKDLNAVYGQNWAKLKKSYDVSCVVTGLNNTAKGCGSFTISVYKAGKLVEVGRVNGGNESFVGRVVDVFAQELTVHGKIRHATFHRFRNDIQPTECTDIKLRDDLKKAARANRKRE